PTLPAPSGSTPGWWPNSIARSASGRPAPSLKQRPEGLIDMAITVRVMERPAERETSYLRATLKGMALTFRHLVSTVSHGREATIKTMEYPEEKWALSPRWRGTHVMEKHEDGRPKCVACGLCPTICPANCIRLVPGEDDQGNRYPIVYEIDEFRCIFCGM